MKRSVVILAGLATLGVVGYLASHLWAQVPGQAAASAATKIGVLNMRTVMKDYTKFQVLDKEIKELRAKYEKNDADIKKNANDVQKTLAQGNLTPEKKEELDKYLLTCKRALEDNNNWWQKVVAKKSEENVTQIYKEIEVAVSSFATTNGFSLILTYYDMTLASEKYNPAFLQHKLEAIMSTSCAYPIYCANGMDVSADIVNNLNRYYLAQPQAAAPGGAQPK